MLIAIGQVTGLAWLGGISRCITQNTEHFKHIYIKLKVYKSKIILTVLIQILAGLTSQLIYF